MSYHGYEGDAPVGSQTLVERPPAGPARGTYAVQAWVVAGLGAMIALAGTVHIARHLLRRGAR